MSNETGAVQSSSLRRKLGRGLGSLISAPVKIETTSQTPLTELAAAERATAISPPHRKDVDADGHDGHSGIAVRALPISSVRPNPKQPRQTFDEASLKQLAESIRTSGLMQPIVVRIDKATAPNGPASAVGTYQIIAGERRWRAAQLAGIMHIPAIVRDVDDRTAAGLSLVENLQREDLNPIERADAFRQLIEDFGLSHQEVATQVGMDRSSVTNHLRLHELDTGTREAVRDGRLSMGHAKALLSITNLKTRSAIAAQAVQQEWSVREIERRVKSIVQGAAATTNIEAPPRVVGAAAANAADLERRLGAHLGTKVKLHQGRRKGSGRLVIEFYSLDQFEGLLRRLQYEGD